MRETHPLFGRVLEVVQSDLTRHDGSIEVRLPDGSAALVPVTWTDVGASGPPAPGVEHPRFDVAGLRAFARLVAILAPKRSKRNRKR